MDLSNLVWRKSSRSGGTGGDCVEVATVWRKSSRSSGTGGECVEVAGGPPGVVAVRDSKDPDGPKLTFTRDEWRTFATHLKSAGLEAR